MSRNDLNELEAELAAAIKAKPAGVDLPGLEAFLELIRKSLPKNTYVRAPGFESSGADAGLM
jgi:hypothetical protein